MRNRLIAFAVVFVVLFVPLILITHPARFVDWLFYAVAILVIEFVVFAASNASSAWRSLGGQGTLSFRPRKRQRFQDRPDEYAYPDSGR
jgi:hypothetical protein